MPKFKVTVEISVGLDIDGYTPEPARQCLLETQFARANFSRALAYICEAQTLQFLSYQNFLISFESSVSLSTRFSSLFFYKINNNFS